MARITSYSKKLGTLLVGAAVFMLTVGAYDPKALKVEKGGTERTSLTAGNVLVGNGTDAVNFVAPGTSGNVLTSNGSTWTSAAPVTGVDPEKTVHVSPSGGDYTTVQAAIDSISDGDTTNKWTVIVHPGTYTVSSTVAMDHPNVTLRGLSRESCIITKATNTTMRISADYCTVENLTIITGANRALICGNNGVSSVQSPVVRNCILQSTTFDTLIIESNGTYQTPNALVEGCYIKGGYDILNYYSNYGLICRNTHFEVTDGGTDETGSAIFTSGATGCYFYDCFFNGAGLYKIFYLNTCTVYADNLTCLKTGGIDLYYATATNTASTVYVGRTTTNGGGTIAGGGGTVTVTPVPYAIPPANIKAGTCANALTLSSTSNNITAGSLTVGSGGTAITKHLSAAASKTWDFSGGQFVTQTITVTGAAVGDVVAIGMPSGAEDYIFSANVSGANTVTISGYDPLSNAGTVTGTARADVWKH